MNDNEAVPPGGIAREAQVVPVPKTISPEAQAYLALMGAPRPPANYPQPSDKEAWRRYIAGQAEMMKQMMAARASAQPNGGAQTVQMNGVTVYVATPAKLDTSRKTRAYLDIHGGALVFGGGESCKMMAGASAERYGVKLYSVDYRMPPDHPFPAALDDCLSVYRALLKTYAPSDIVIGGGSAGGNLAAATLLKARDEGLPMPAGLVLFTPMTDLTESGDSFETVERLDVVLRKRLYECGALYAGGEDLKNPYISPQFGEFAGLPRTFLQTGTRDLFLSNTVLLHRAMRKAGVQAELHVWEAMPHGGFGGASPEDADVTAETRRFLNACWSA